jgi:hypothetical protein
LRWLDSSVLRLALNAVVGGSVGVCLFLCYGLPPDLKRELIERAPGKFNPILRCVLAGRAR